MADRQRAGITGNATMRVPITGDVNVGGRAVRELRFMPRSAFPEVGRSDVLYIDTLGECIYYWDGSEYVQLSGGGSGTDNYNALQNRPKINNVTLEGEQTSSDLGLQSSIDDLSSIRSGAAAGATALQPEDIDTLPTDGSSNPVSSGGTYNFVNSSIATNTAYFIGTFASVAELEAYSGTVTNNDYAFVTSTDSAGNTLYNRYKYNAANQIWSFEYAVNNTAFTTAQWAAIQSGMTSADKTKLDGIETGANKTVIDASPTSGSSNAVSSGGVYTALSGKQDIISDLSDIRSGASAGATAVQPSALNDYQTKLSGTNKLDPSYIDYDASHRAVSDTEKSTWNGKQDAISDLATIRSGAAAGATAVQPADITAAIAALDVAEVGGAGQYISAISETDGKISPTPTNFDTSLSSSSTNSNAPTTRAVYDDQQRQETEIGVVANAGAKNLCPKETETSTGSGFTSDVPVNIPAGTYILSFTGTLAYTASLSLYRALPHSGNSLANVNISATTGTQSIEFTISEAAKYIAFYHNGSGNSLTNIMIRPASITDTTFKPYALPNPTLTPAVIKAVDEGAKNLADMSKSSFTTLTKDGVTVTLSGDTITSSGTGGTATNNFFNIFYDSNVLLVPSGTWVISLVGTGIDNFRIEEYDNAHPDVVKGDFGQPLIVTVPDNATRSYIRITSKPSTNCAGTFKLMICTAADWAVSQKFVPYAPTNRELYEMIQMLQNNS